MFCYYYYYKECVYILYSTVCPNICYYYYFILRLNGIFSFHRVRKKQKIQFSRGFCRYFRERGEKLGVYEAMNACSVLAMQTIGSCLKTGQHFIFVILYLLLLIKYIFFYSVSKILIKKLCIKAKDSI